MGFFETKLLHAGYTHFDYQGQMIHNLAVDGQPIVSKCHHANNTPLSDVSKIISNLAGDTESFRQSIIERHNNYLIAGQVYKEPDMFIGNNEAIALFQEQVQIPDMKFIVWDEMPWFILDSKDKLENWWSVYGHLA